MIGENRENARQTLVSRLGILHTPPEKNFDDLAELARFVTGARVAFITYLDGDLLWIKAHSGETPWTEFQRNEVPCGDAIDANEPRVISDLRADPKWRDRSQKILKAGFRFYASIPLIDGDLAMGTLVLLDSTARQLTPREMDSLTAVARSAVLESEHRMFTDPSGLVAEVLKLRLSNAQMKEAMRAWQTAEARLSNSFRQRDEFLSVATHELRTPVTAMKLVLQFLAKLTMRKETLTRQEVNKSLEPALRQTEKLRVLIDSLLDLSRIREGRLQLDLEPFDLTTLVHEVCARLEQQSKWTHATLFVKAPSPVHGQWDRLRIEQVVTNLVSNAIKYGEGNPIEVAVQGEGKLATLIVSDRGIGIAPENHSGIFEQYERATPLHQTDSMGLGLFVVREIIRAHCGSVQVKSDLGKGATFIVHLPLQPDRNYY